MFCSVPKDVSPPAPAEQVKVRAYLRERVTRGINAVNPGDWVEDDLPSLRRLLIDAGGQSYCPEGDFRTVCRPRGAGVRDIICGLGHLDKNSELDGLPAKPWTEFVEQEVRRHCRRFLVGEILCAAFREHGAKILASRQNSSVRLLDAQSLHF